MNAFTLAEQPAASRTVMVGVPTFHRPGELARLLEAMPAVITEVHKQGLAAQVELLVVDNDPRGSARLVVSRSPLPVRYVVEQRPGVAAVRNRILDESRDHDLLAFIDDDETPADSQWLSRLIMTRDRFAAHGVAGSVVTVAGGGMDAWVDAGGFFARTHREGLPTGAVIARAATNNLLLDRRYIAEIGLNFDERFGRTGGEDSLFTASLTAGGARLVWDASATVVDHLPPARRTRAHAIDRTRAMAAVGVRVDLALHRAPIDRLFIRARTCAIAAVRYSGGAAAKSWGTVTGSTRAHARGVRRCARAIGAMEGAMGRLHETYGENP